MCYVRDTQASLTLRLVSPNSGWSILSWRTRRATDTTQRYARLLILVGDKQHVMQGVWLKLINLTSCPSGMASNSLLVTGRLLQAGARLRWRISPRKVRTGVR